MFILLKKHYRSFVLTMSAFLVIGLLSGCTQTATSSIAGSWSITHVDFLGESEAGSVDAGFSIDEEGWRKSSNVLVFDRSGSFHSEVKYVNEQVFAGQSLDLTQYTGWSFVADNKEANQINGKIIFTPPVEDYNYSLSLSQDNVMTLTISELYMVESEVADGGYITKGGEIPMTYTITLCKTPEE